MDLAFLIEPFQPRFMQRALAEVLLLAIPAGLVGAWVVTRRLAFATHALGHATFPALVIATLAGWTTTGSALVAAIVAALLIARLAEHPALRSGVAVAIVLSTALGLGVVLVSGAADPGARANSLLFGSLLASNTTALVTAGLVAAGALALTLTFGRPLAAATFSRDAAIADGMPVRRADTALMIALAAATAVAVPIVGSLLVSALLLVPAATARLVTRRVVPLLVAGTVLAAAEGVVGLWIAFHADAPPGATIALVAAVVFVLVGIGRAAVEAVRRRPRPAMIPT